MDTVSIISIVSSAIITLINIIAPIIKAAIDNKNVKTQKELQLFTKTK